MPAKKEQTDPLTRCRAALRRAEREAVVLRGKLSLLEWHPQPTDEVADCYRKMSKKLQTTLERRDRYAEQVRELDPWPTRDRPLPQDTAQK